MGNMSYCRFENTAKNLRDCYNAIMNGETGEMSKYEIEGLKDILNLSEKIYNLRDSINIEINDSEKALKEIEEGTYY